MKVFITGGTGFIGGEIISQLLAAGHGVRALVRVNTAKGTGRMPAEIEMARGDALDADLARHLAGVDAVIHLVGIIREFPGRGITFQKLHVEAARNVIAAMKSAGVKRLIHMSALGAGPEGRGGYFRSKWTAESAVRESGLDWTVMKPSVVFGPRDEFVNMLAGQVRRLPAVPVIGDGESLLQPVSVHNVAAGFVKALATDAAIGQVYKAGGPERITYNALLDAIARALGKPSARKVHLPLGLMRPMISALQGLSFFPITIDQFDMLLMNNVCEPGPFFEAFAIEPIAFGDGIREYVKP
jgi:uncharacterized protein YbjT (DUF2867 family)